MYIYIYIYNEHVDTYILRPIIIQERDIMKFNTFGRIHCCTFVCHGTPLLSTAIAHQADLASRLAQPEPDEALKFEARLLTFCTEYRTI